jgi:transposase InsO family protein
MGLSRRQFTKEFKLAAIQRLERGVSNRGTQYASNDYTDLLRAKDIKISMSRKASPWDNADVNHS